MRRVSSQRHSRRSVDVLPSEEADGAEESPAMAAPVSKRHGIGDRQRDGAGAPDTARPSAKCIVAGVMKSTPGREMLRSVADLRWPRRCRGSSRYRRVKMVVAGQCRLAADRKSKSLGSMKSCRGAEQVNCGRQRRDTAAVSDSVTISPAAIERPAVLTSAAAFAALIETEELNPEPSTSSTSTSLVPNVV